MSLTSGAGAGGAGGDDSPADSDEEAEAAAAAAAAAAVMAAEDALALLAGLMPSVATASLSPVSLFVRLRWSLLVLLLVLPLALPLPLPLPLSPEVQHGQFFRTLERTEQRRFDFRALPSSGGLQSISCIRLVRSFTSYFRFHIFHVKITTRVGKSSTATLREIGSFIYVTSGSSSFPVESLSCQQ